VLRADILKRGNMSNSAVIAAIRKYLWVAAAFSLTMIYIANPLWPHSVARFPWRWWVTPIFLIVALLLCYRALYRDLTLFRAFALTAALLLYLSLEGFFANLIYAAITSSRPMEFEGYAYVGIMSMFSKQFVVLAFAAFCVIRLVIGRR
jgi:hypothetical protein